MRSETLRSTLGLTLVLIVCYLLQGAVFSPLQRFGCAPLLLPLFAVGTGLIANAAWGGVFGLLAGILCDAAMGTDGLAFTVALTAMGFFAGFLGDFVLSRGYPGYFVLCVLTLLICAGVEIFPLLFLRSSVPALLLTALKQSAVSLVLTLPLYICLRRALRSWLRLRSRGLTERNTRES